MALILLMCSQAILGHILRRLGKMYAGNPVKQIMYSEGNQMPQANITREE